VPQPIATIALQNKDVVYNILFRATGETVRTIAADPKHRGAQIGFFAVLHTCGYYGVFELEFVLAEGKAMLIDFNGPFYQQMEFDMARGMELPALAYAAATGNQAEVTRIMAQGNSGEHDDVNRFGLATMVKTQRIVGTMSRKDAARWLDWSRGLHGTMIDAIRDPHDALPTFVDVAHYLLHALRHPRAFVRQYGLVEYYPTCAS
jgi:hypothetical protein